MLGVPGSAAAEWKELRTPDFLFIGDAPDGAIRSTAQRLEQFRAALAQLLPGDTPAPVPTVVIVFNNDRSFRLYRPRYEGRAVDVAGWFQGGEDVNYIATNADAGDIAYAAILHEYAHFVNAHRAGHLPVWVSEGLAEVFENFEPRADGRSAIIGRAPKHHVDLLQGSTLMPLSELLAVEPDSPVYNEGNRRGVFYAQSWALVHYLMLNEQRSAQLRTFLRLVRTGAAPAAALQEAFGSDLRPLETELGGYVRQFSFPAMLVNLDPAAVRRVDGRPQPIADEEARGYLGDVLARLGQSDEAREHLGKVLEANPVAVRAMTALGLLELRAGNIAAALPLLERAAQAGPGDASAQAALGRALIARVAEQGDDRGAQMATLERARPVLAKAVEIEARAYTTALLGYVELASGKDVARAATLLERAAREAPVREQYALMAGEAFLRLNQLDRARGYLGPLLAQGREAEIRDAAREMLGRLAEIQTRASAAAAPAAGGGARPAGDPARPSTEPPAGPGPRPSAGLRRVNDGEIRVLGAFTAVECRAEDVVLSVDVGGKTMRLGAARFQQIQFISYVPDAPRTVGCGPLPSPMRVLATYRSGGATGTDGEAVAIEAIPADYMPE